MPKKKAGQPPPPADTLPDEPPPSDEPVRVRASTSGAPKSGLCGYHLLALLPILLAFGIYYLPTILDEYNARYG